MSDAPVRVFVPRDSAALSVGADEVAHALAAEAARRGPARRRSCATARAGCSGSSRSSRSTTPAGRVAYGPVAATRRARPLRRAGCSRAARTALRLGLTEELPYLEAPGAADVRAHRRHRPAEPRRLRGARRLARACARRSRSPGARGGRRGSRRSGLRGRGGAGFPTGIKWKTVLDTPADREVRRLQRRRGRLGHVLRPHGDGGRPVSPDRGHGDRRRRPRRDAGLHLPALGVPRRRAHRSLEAIATRARGGLPRRRRARQRQGVRPRAAARRRLLRLRRGDGAAREPRGQARHRALPAADAGGRGPVRQADGAQQRDHARVGADHPRHRAPTSTATSAWAARAARCRSSWRAT